METQTGDTDMSTNPYSILRVETLRKMEATTLSMIADKVHVKEGYPVTVSTDTLALIRAAIAAKA
jgi:hypothetical protein